MAQDTNQVIDLSAVLGLSKPPPPLQVGILQGVHLTAKPNSQSSLAKSKILRKYSKEELKEISFEPVSEPFGDNSKTKSPTTSATTDSSNSPNPSQELNSRTKDSQSNPSPSVNLVDPSIVAIKSFPEEPSQKPSFNPEAFLPQNKRTSEEAKDSKEQEIQFQGPSSINSGGNNTGKSSYSFNPAMSRANRNRRKFSMEAIPNYKVRVFDTIFDGLLSKNDNRFYLESKDMRTPLPDSLKEPRI